MLNELESYKIVPGLHSDHSLLKIDIGNEIHNRGKGLWKFNNSSLHDVNYVKEIKKIIKDCETEYKPLEDRGLAWEITKMKIRSFSVLYCVKKKRDPLAFKKTLEKELDELQQTLDFNPSQPSQELYVLNKKELEQIEKKK